MSTQMQCQTCQATYLDTEPDGTIYFHVCAPVVDPKTGVLSPPPNGRNENLTIRSDWTAAGIVSAGAGTKPVKGQVAADPAWLTKLQGKIAAQEV